MDLSLNRLKQCKKDDPTMQNRNIHNLDESRLELNRRHFIGYFSAIGLGSTLLPGTLTAVAQDAEKITAEMVAAAAKIAGLTLPQETLQGIANQLSGPRSLITRYQNIRALNITNGMQPAVIFNPVPAGMKLPAARLPLRRSLPNVTLPKSDEELAFLPVIKLSRLIRTRQITSTQLTKLYLERLKKYDPILHCVVTLTEDLALKQAAQADKEIAAGKYRGPLHGIPWGAKDLLAVKGYKTTFGASPYKDQMLDMDATVYTRLTEAGAVLVGKLTLGALAQGDRWFGGQTKSPWDPTNEKTGSSGSSAGPAACTAAGLVGFAIGTETRGSIMSPSSRCGVTGLRPTFGRVSRYGAMALSWTMDKIGSLCRSAEDCALVLRVINGPDGKDNSLVDVPFNWDVTRNVKKLRVGYLKATFDREIAEDPANPQRSARAKELRKINGDAFAVIRSLGIELKPIDLPQLPASDLDLILSVESAAAFDDITRNNQIELMVKEPERSNWPGTFRLHRFVPAVEYIQANRARYKMMEDFSKVFADIDLFIGSSLSVTNLTGHPEVSIPHGFDSQGQPTALNFTGKLFGDQEILLLAHAFQSKTDHHLKHPKL
jgi:Asp-tRNA(Asn)/Glu-tRNA(Gln) amidotransferase A subunit family amidase